MSKLILLVALVLVGTTGVAAAYPQFQLSRDTTCTSCHISPAGGNLLNENGESTAETMSQYGTAPEFMYGLVPQPKWLVLGGDLRGAAGYIKTPEDALAAFPMQIELYANATFGPITAHVNVGPATSIFTREHYLMWQQNPGASDGLYVRAGRFMPVFGLRLAEHPVYIRRYGGTPLLADTYALAVEYVTPEFEVHATGWIEDPISDPVQHADGGSVLAEYRLSSHASIGAEAMLEKGTHDTKYRGGVLGKLYLEGPDVLLQTEVQYVLQKIDPVGAPNQIVGYLMASKMMGSSLMLDVGFGHYDSNIRVGRLDRDCVDVNLHWFTTSHLELVLNGRFELIGWNQGADPGAYALLQMHYRL